MGRAYPPELLGKRSVLSQAHPRCTEPDTWGDLNHSLVRNAGPVDQIGAPMQCSPLFATGGPFSGFWTYKLDRRRTVRTI